MTIEETREVLNGYFSGHNPDALAEDAVFIHIETDERYEGRQAIAGMLAYIYGEAFDASASMLNLVVGEGTAVPNGR